MKPNRWTSPTTLAVLALFAGVAHAALDPEVSTDRVGKPAPAFSLKSVDGKDVAVGSQGGRVVLVTFFASWCPPCRSELLELKALHERVSGRPVSTLLVAVDPILTPDSVGDVGPLATKLGLPFAVALATQQMADAYGFKGIPTTMTIGPDGSFGRTFYGYHDGKEIEAAALEMLPATAAKP